MEEGSGRSSRRPGAVLACDVEGNVHARTQTDTDRHRQTQTDIDACVLDGKWGANTQKHLDVYVRVCLYMYVYLYLDPYL